ncbi:MAG: hypothetical protein ACFFCS_07125 [Candidatus Hodarchaeota archaeon]
MSEHSLENLLRELDKEKEEDRIEVLQSIVEKILTSVLTTIETTDMQIANLSEGINNVSRYLTQQFSDLTTRLKELPGLKDINAPELPQLATGIERYHVHQSFVQELKDFIASKAEEISRLKPEKEEKDIGLEGELAEISSEATEKVTALQKELEAKEKYLSRLAEQLATKNLQLQERERSIEIIEQGLEDEIKMSAALQMAGLDEKGSLREEEDLKDLSDISESILQGENFDDDDEDDELMKELLESDDSTED